MLTDRAQFQLQLLLGTFSGESYTAQAYRYSSEAHQNQVRKYSGVPYIEHPIYVAYLTMQNIPSDYAFMADEICAAALLHDVAEDTSRTVAMIRYEFGNTVADLVSQLTFPVFDPGTSRELKVMTKVGQFSQMSPTAKLIKLCDRYHNLMCAKQDDQKFFRRYARETLPMLYCVEHTHLWAPKLILSKLWYLINHLDDEGIENERI